MPSPFKLFDPYTASDKEVFFGRDAEIYALYNLLQQTRLVLIYGASGTGKTSIIQAGLPKVFKLTDWFRISVRWRDDINASLRNELGKLMEDADNITSLEEAITEIYEDRWIPIYLVFDQFEEIFTLGTHEERLIFFQDIQQLLDKSLPCKIILSMREEYIGHLYEYEYIVPSLFDKRFRIEAMKDGTVQTVLDEMVHEFTKERTRKEIVQKIFKQLKEGKQAVHLPYLQVYLHYLYEHSAQASLPIYFTGTNIKAIGKLGNVIKRFIETISNEAQTLFTQWGLPNTFAADLLDEFATTEGTKQAGKVEELTNKLEANENMILDALQYFTERKLLRADENDVNRYEPVHDVVAMQIHELRSVENKDFKAFLRQLQNNYELWLNEAKSESRLLVEKDVANAEIYQERLNKRPEFGIWKEYVEQSRIFNNHRLEEEKRKNEELQSALFTSKRNANWAIGVAVLAIMFVFLAFVFYSNAKESEEAAITAQKAAQENLLQFQQTEINNYLLDAETFQKSGNLAEAKVALDSARSITERYFKENIKYDSLMKEIDKRKQKQTIKP